MNVDFGTNFGAVIVVFHKKVLSDSLFGERIKKLLDNNNVKTHVYTTEDINNNPYHSVDLKKNHGYPTFIINLCFRSIGNMYRSDVTLPLDCVSTYRYLVEVLLSVFKNIYGSAVEFLRLELDNLSAAQMRVDNINQPSVRQWIDTNCDDMRQTDQHDGNILSITIEE